MAWQPIRRHTCLSVYSETYQEHHQSIAITNWCLGNLSLIMAIPTSLSFKETKGVFGPYIPARERAWGSVNEHRYLIGRGGGGVGTYTVLLRNAISFFTFP